MARRFKRKSSTKKTDEDKDKVKPGKIKQAIHTNKQNTINNIYIIDDELDFITEIYNFGMIDFKLIDNLFSRIKENSSVFLDYEKNIITIHYEYEKTQFWQGYNKTIVFKGNNDISFKFCGSVQRYINKSLEAIQ